MEMQPTPRPLFETDHITWTRDKLNARIRENERLIERLGSETEDEDFVWIRELLVEDLTVKRRMLDEMER